MTYTYTAMYSSAIVACIVLLSLGLVGNAVILAVNLADVRRLAGDVVLFRVGMKQVGMGLPCIANIALGVFAVAWFPYVAIAEAEYLRHLGPTCVVVSAMFVWSGVLYLLGLLTMAVDRVLAVRRLRLRIPEDEGPHRSAELTARGIWLAIAGFWLYATTVCVVLSVSGGLRNAMSMLCTVHVDDGYFWATVVAGYIFPFAVIVACISTAAAMACTRLPPPDEDRQIVEGQVESELQKQIGLLKYLAVLVFCWVVGNVPLVYFLRGTASRDVETALVVTMVCHQLVLPVTTFVSRRRVWNGLVRVFRVLRRRRKRRAIGNSGVPMTQHYEGESTTTGDVELPGPSSCEIGDGEPPKLPRGSGVEPSDSKSIPAEIVNNVVQYHRQSWEDSDDELSGDETLVIPEIDLSFSSKDCSTRQRVSGPHPVDSLAGVHATATDPDHSFCKAADRERETSTWEDSDNDDAPMDHNGTGDHGADAGTGFGDVVNPSGVPSSMSLGWWSSESSEVSTTDHDVPTTVRFLLDDNLVSVKHDK